MQISKPSFHCDDSASRFSCILVTGVCRSGKSTIANMLGACDGAEVLEEPWQMRWLPILATLGLMDSECARGMISTGLSEAMTEQTLGRGFNFRGVDQSCIWRRKPPTQVASQMQIPGRAAVNAYLSENACSLILNIPEMLPYLDFFRDAIPGIRIVHVVRNGLDVAQAVNEKAWLSDEQLWCPANAQLYRRVSFRGRTWHVPWWVRNEDQEGFLLGDAVMRALYYWLTVLEQGRAQLEAAVVAGTAMTIRFEDFLSEPAETANEIFDFLGLRATPWTRYKIGEICERPKDDPSVARQAFHRLPANLIKSVHECMEYFGYPRV